LKENLMLRPTLLALLTLTLAFVLAPAVMGDQCTPQSDFSCSCDYGVDFHGNPIDPADTCCGYQVCGADDQNYQCTATGWQAIGGGPCGTPPDRCACSGGTAFDGTVVSSDATFCGMQICGLDNTLYECRPSGWHGIGGGPCGQGEAGNTCDYDASACSCPDGASFDPNDPYGIEIPTSSTYCGMTVCGADNSYYECTAGGWNALGEGPCYPAGTADNDGDGLTDGLEHVLMNRFAPRIRLHMNDPYRPASVDWFLDRVHMRFHHENNCPDHQILDLGEVNTINLITRQHSPNVVLCAHDQTRSFSSSGNEERAFFLQIPNDSNETLTRRGTTPEDWTCYAHVFPSSSSNNVPAGNIDIQYWMFYPFNGAWDSSAFSVHEGDWEHVTVRVDADTLEPLSFYIAAHAGGERLPWDEVRCTDDGHPVSYSALDTHAGYPTDGTFWVDIRADDTSLLGPIWDCGDRLINLGERNNTLPGASWNTYNGHWGEIGSGGDKSGPHGPHLNGKWDGDPN
jgi:hypothetical protein